MRRLLTAIALSVFALGAQAQFQGLIINEFSQGDQGSREYIELLVVGTRTCTDSTADLRGWIFDDQNGWYGTGSITAGHYRFKNVSSWAAVPFGSIIVFYNSASGEKNLSITTADDPADANHDYNYILPINSSAYIEENDIEPLNVPGPLYVYPLASAVTGYAGSSNTWIGHLALNNGGDVISTVSPADRTTAFFSIGYNFPVIPGFQSPTVSVGNVNGGMNCYLSTSNYSTPGSWLIGNADPLLGAVSETPGFPNGGANTTWINSMRQQFSLLAPGVNANQPNCNNNTGSISITSPFGPGYSYSKDGINYNPFNTIFTGLSQGVYSITVMYNGCVSPPSVVTINAAPSTPATPAVTLVQPDCNSPTGTLTINTPTGTGLTYSISGTYQSSNVFTGVSPGTYGVTAKNSSGCTSSATIITIDPPPPALAAPVVNITSQPTCANPIGSISITSPVGMTYSVDGFDYSNTTGIFNNLPAGNYNVTAKNNLGCTSPATAIVINAPPQAPATPILTIGQTSCNSAAGSIMINSPTGTGLSYSIDGINYSAQTVYNSLPPGNYSVSVQDAIGCTSASIPVIINPQPATPVAPAITVLQPTCTNSTGTININSPTGMNYSLDGIDYNNTSGVFSNLLPGNYTVTAQNASGCTSPSTDVVIDPQPPTPVVSVNSPTVCQGSNAIITATTSTAGSYNYVWTVPAGETNPGSVASFTATIAGNYSVTVTNMAGCGAIASGILNVVSIAAVTVDDKTVCQNATVQLTAQPAGGTWSGVNVSGSVFNAAGLNPGTYPATYTYNSGGCSGSATATITIAALPVFASVNILQPDCVSTTGTITITSPLGAGFNYSIDAINYSSNTVFGNLIPSSYVITVQNAAGCLSTSNPVVINNAPSSPSAPVFTISQPTCTTNTGSITVNSPTGNGLTYSIDGSNYQASALFANIASGNHNITVQNVSGCISPVSTAVINPQPSVPPIPSVSITQPGCNGTLGTITINSPGAGHSYSIDGINYFSSPVFNQVAPGSYTVRAQNNAGCISDTVVTVNQPPANFSVSVNTSTGNLVCPVPSAGLTNVVASVSTPGVYNYTWTVPQGVTDPGNVFSFVVNTPGNYSVTVTDNNGCSAAASVTINMATPVTPSMADDKQVCLNSSVTLTSQTPGGTWVGNYVSGSMFNAATAAPGVYTVFYVLPTNSYCVYSEAQVTVIPLPPAPTVTVLDNCASSTLTASNVTGTVLWSNNATTASINVTTPGTYSVTQTVNGCTSVAATAIASPVAAQVQNQHMNGCLSVAYNGSTYNASTIVNDTLRSVNGCDSIIHIVNIVVAQPSISNITVCKPAGQSYDFNGSFLSTSGHYTDTLTSFNGCDSIIHLDLLIASTQSNTISGCETVLFNGVTYTSNTTVNDVIPSIVTGCDSIIRITSIIVNPKPEITTSEDKVICKGDSVELTASAIGAIIQWLGFAGGNEITVTPNFNTTYVAIATSAAGCSDTGSVTVNINQFEIQLTATGTQFISGSTVHLQTSSSSNYDVLSWTPTLLFPGQNATTQTFTLDSSVDVMVIAQSLQGCKDSASITIIANPLDDIYIPSAFTPNGDGKNDLFRVMGGDLRSFELRIFNRWGELIFSSKERAKGWDGTLAGKMQPEAVYVYAVTVTLRNGKTVFKKGTVTLLR